MTPWNDLDSKHIAALAAVTAASAYLTYKLIRQRSSGQDSATSTLRGLKNRSLLVGNLPELLDPDVDELEKWLEEYGTVFSMHGFFSTKELYLADQKALAYIVSKPMSFVKPARIRAAIESLTGYGVFAAEGEAHKKHRRVLNPAFSVPQIKQLTGVMLQKGYDLKDIWTSMISPAPGASEPVTIDVLDWLGRAALDAIGEAGFGYRFETLHDSSNELANAFQAIFAATTAVDIVRILGNFIPIISKLPLERNLAPARNLEVMRRVGTQLVEEKKSELAQLVAAGEDNSSLLGKDLLSVLIKSNMEESDSHKLSDDEVLAQIATFLFAGQETSSTALAWTLYALAKDRRIQMKLRDELLAFPNDQPSLDELNSLTYLDWVVKEVLRLHTPIHTTNRTPVADEVIPLSEPVIDQTGRTVHEILVKAGEGITISNAAFNWGRKWWGPDAHEFRPERFENPPAAVNAIPSVFAGVTTFGAGTKACIGWRFAIAEMKAILFVLVRNFKFDIDPSLVIKSQTLIVAKPVIAGREGYQLPLKVSAYDAGP